VQAAAPWVGHPTSPGGPVCRSALLMSRDIAAVCSKRLSSPALNAGGPPPWIGYSIAPTPRRRPREHCAPLGRPQFAFTPDTRGGQFRADLGPRRRRRCPANRLPHHPARPGPGERRPGRRCRVFSQRRPAGASGPTDAFGRLAARADRRRSVARASSLPRSAAPQRVERIGEHRHDCGCPHAAQRRRGRGRGASSRTQKRLAAHLQDQRLARFGVPDVVGPAVIPKQVSGSRPDVLVGAGERPSPGAFGQAARKPFCVSGAEECRPRLAPDVVARRSCRARTAGKSRPTRTPGPASFAVGHRQQQQLRTGGHVPGRRDHRCIGQPTLCPFAATACEIGAARPRRPWSARSQRHTQRCAYPGRPEMIPTLSLARGGKTVRACTIADRTLTCVFVRSRSTPVGYRSVTKTVSRLSGPTQCKPNVRKLPAQALTATDAGHLPDWLYLQAALRTGRRPTDRQFSRAFGRAIRAVRQRIRAGGCRGAWLRRAGGGAQSAAGAASCGGRRRVVAVGGGGGGPQAGGGGGGSAAGSFVGTKLRTP